CHGFPVESGQDVASQGLARQPASLELGIGESAELLIEGSRRAVVGVGVCPGRNAAPELAQRQEQPSLGASSRLARQMLAGTRADTKKHAPSMEISSQYLFAGQCRGGLTGAFR